ncbi:hypothetical protein M408DRAFT_326377 [Serendipita vermifera MAFF 305830]|uniref:Uncharacterized protein n=1 Tax=Serendipita vermifera MAFF 305830 TaxID=933852 RepID=A0A0C2XUQ8_SERVB|nr:hypothetical protein M408DRAFT_326377 [Serendipita vermifera MAFF 305830]
MDTRRFLDIWNNDASGFKVNSMRGAWGLEQWHCGPKARQGHESYEQMSGQVRCRFKSRGIPPLGFPISTHHMVPRPPSPKILVNS